MIMVRDDDSEVRSGSKTTEAPSDENPNPNQLPKNKHNKRPIQEMETFFKAYPYPNDKKRTALSRELGKIRAENFGYKEALRNASCLNLRIENALLRQEIDRVIAKNARFLRELNASVPVEAEKPKIVEPEGWKRVLKLAERMKTSFCTGVGAWPTRKSMDGTVRSPGTILIATASFYIPVPPKCVFDFLRDKNSRNKWDILSNGGLVQEIAHIANGRDPGNCVSLLRVNSPNSSQSNMLILQESCTDATGSYVIYAPVDIVDMNAVFSGGDSNCVALMPSGFTILHDGTGHGGGGNPEIESGGSILTVAIQIKVDSVPKARISRRSVAMVKSLIKCTVERIKTSVAMVEAS